jgi:hypothetical protein
VGSHGRTYYIAPALQVRAARENVDGTALAMAGRRRFAVTTLIAMFIQVLLSLHAATPAQTVKTVVADGSVWVDVYEGGSLKRTTRLCDHNVQRASSLVAKGKGSSAK